MDHNIIRPRYIDLLNNNQKKIVNKFSITPSNSNNSISILVDFIYNSHRYKFEILIPEKYYEGAKKANHIISYSQNLLSDNEAHQLYYESMILERSQELFYQKILTEFYNIKVKEGLTNDEYLELITKYVQSLPYDYHKASQSDFKLNYPIETAVEGKGICGDKSVLLAGLLSCSGYAVSLLEFDTENHMMVGIPSEKSNGNIKSVYYFIETTISRVIGLKPQNDTKITKSSPKIYQIGYGKLKYKNVKNINLISGVAEYIDRKLSSDNYKHSSLVNLFSNDFNKAVYYNELVTLYNDIEDGEKSISELISEIKSCKHPDIKKLIE